MKMRRGEEKKDYDFFHRAIAGFMVMMLIMILSDMWKWICVNVELALQGQF